MAKLAKRPTLVRMGVAEGRPLTREDVQKLVKERRTDVVSKVVKLKESHHYVARLVAAGLDDLAVAERTGYSGNRIYQLRHSPAFKELVAKFQKQVTEGMIEEIDEYHRLALGNMIAAERHISDAIHEADEAGELITIQTALKISRDAADRFGYGKKNTNINVNVDFAAQLEAAIRRSGKTIDQIPAGNSGSPQTALPSIEASTPAAVAGRSPFIRRF